jgi:Putative DNA-binding domain
MTLLQLQNNFITYLHQTRDDNFANAEEQITAAVVDDGKLTASERLNIYHHAYRGRLIEVMQDVFERTWAYLGDETFEASAAAFIEANPATEKTLNHFGQQFPDWLISYFPDDIDIAEVAKIDWMMRVAFDSENATPLVGADLAALSPDDWATVGFMFHPALVVVPIEYNAASIWEALEANNPPPSATPLLEKTFLLVWRKELRPHYLTIGQHEADAIALIGEGLSFADTCATLDSRYPNTSVAETIGMALRRWLDEEMLVGFST